MLISCAKNKHIQLVKKFENWLIININIKREYVNYLTLRRIKYNFLANVFYKKLNNNIRKDNRDSIIIILAGVGCLIY